MKTETQPYDTRPRGKYTGIIYGPLGNHVSEFVLSHDWRMHKAGDVIIVSPATMNLPEFRNQP